MNKILIISASAIVTLVCMVIWMNRYETRKYLIGGDTVYVKENKITGARCTIKDGMVNITEHPKVFNLPDWC